MQLPAARALAQLNDRLSQYKQAEASAAGPLTAAVPVYWPVADDVCRRLAALLADQHGLQTTFHLFLKIGSVDAPKRRIWAVHRLHDGLE